MNNDIISIGISACAAGLAAKFTWNKLVTTTVVPQHFVCIHTRHGRHIDVLSSGRYRYFGTGHDFQMFDTREQEIALQAQELTTSEGLSVKMTAIGSYRVSDPLKATAAASNYTASLYTMIQLALRDAVNGLDTESLLASVRSIGVKLHESVKAKAADLGIELTGLMVRDLILPADVKAALSESWRSKKSAIAQLEVARGKAAAARCVANSARIYESNPALLKLRYIEALEQAAKGMGNTFVVGLPDDKTLKNI